MRRACARYLFLDIDQQWGESGPFALATPGPTLEDQTAASEMRERIPAVIKTLPQSEREVASLYWIEHVSIAEIADKLGIPPGTVRARLCRAKRKILKALSTSHGGAVVTSG